MVKLANSLSRLQPAKILVIGDMLLDSYTFGKTRRLSPEAPVAIVNVLREEHRPGGSGNVILNLLSLEADVVSIGRVGNDWAGHLLCEELQKEGIDTHSIFKEEGYKTPVKNRVIADNQQIVRIDHEQITPLTEKLERQIIEALPRLMKDIKMVAVSDYGKGFLSHNLLQAIMLQAKKQECVVITDPKGHDFKKYRGTTIIKPNLSEAYAAANMAVGTPLAVVAQKILEITDAEYLMVTRSEAGISLFDADGGQHDFPVQAKEVKDVTGAGDTVLAMLGYALANELSYSEAVELCNVAAGIAIEHVGCARISLADLAKRLLETNMSQKVFDHDHLFVLQKVLKDNKYNLLVIKGERTLSTPLFQTIKRLAEEKITLVVSVNSADCDPIFIDMLASLSEISFILIDQESVDLLCSKTHPQVYQSEWREDEYQCTVPVGVSA